MRTRDLEIQNLLPHILNKHEVYIILWTNVRVKIEESN